MERKTRYRLLREYVRYHKKTLYLFILFSVIFAAVFSLYNMEAEAVFYASGLCLLAAVVVLCIDFTKFYGKHRGRMMILKDIEYEYEHLPEAVNLVEEDYSRMLYALGQINNAHLTDWRQERQESLDYYTLWVHQIKTPIAVMRMTLQGEDTVEHRELLAELFRIEQYADMVLTYIRLGSDRTDFVFQEYDLDTIIKQAIHKYAPLFVRCKIGLIYEPARMTVLTDEKWLLFILEQLLSNAVKYTRGGSVTVSVSPEQVLSVTDTGIGILPEDLPRIFDKGFTGYHGRTDKKATGLGLYLCKQTADKLGIPICVTSEPGKGSTFSLDLHKERPELE